MTNARKQKTIKKKPSRLARKRAIVCQNTNFFDVINPQEPFEPIKKPRGKSMKYIITLMIVNSGEIPTNLGKLMNIKQGTFRAYISDLYDDNLIRLNKNDKIHTYMLSTRGKYILKEHRPFINTPNDISSRKRHIRLAKLNAYFWGLDISIFRHQNPPAKNIANNIEAQRTLHFYNSYYLKPTVTEYPENIKRSKSFGLLTGYNKHYLVYYEPMATDFYFEENLFRITVSRFIGTEINEMLLVLDSYYQAAFWLYFLFDFTEFFCGDQPSRLFEKVKILVMDKHAQNALYTLINEEKIEKQIINDYNLDAYSAKYEFLLTLDGYKLNNLIWQAKENPQETYCLITTPYLIEIVNVMTKDTEIIVYSVSDEDWKKYVS